MAAEHRAPRVDKHCERADQRRPWIVADQRADLGVRTQDRIAPRGVPVHTVLVLRLRIVVTSQQIRRHLAEPADLEFCQQLTRVRRVADTLERVGHIAAGSAMLRERVDSAGMVREEAGHVVHAPVDDDPAVARRAVRRHLAPAERPSRRRH